MGARNVTASFHRWAGRVPGNSLALLVFMAVVSKDGDDWPWYGQGQASLAELAMGRPNPNRADLRAVSRAMQPLLDTGAVTVDRAGAARSDGNTTARYRLNLHERADAEREKWEQTYDGKRRTSDARRDPQHTTVSGRDIRRKVTQHTTVSDATYDGNRRTKEKEKTKRSEKTKEEAVDLPVAVTLPREPSAVPKTAPVIPLYPDSANAPGEKPYAPPPQIGRTWRTGAMDAIAEATARRAAAKAAHQATLAAEKSTEVS